uniref:Uncharacterized protein n=1 Tax=Arundo donax TaxID=35708 RepID=A0A0A9A514_ARUDO
MQEIRLYYCQYLSSQQILGSHRNYYPMAHAMKLQGFVS